VPTLADGSSGVKSLQRTNTNVLRAYEQPEPTTVKTYAGNNKLSRRSRRLQKAMLSIY
jgi:hypothetical protein